ncbi:hypothetical protein BKA62DRAFT_761818 [Auriculariales sp. MPI-PUGE-AT-0066]|nr:hypothetical protein BKA62DRAFT_761818 [Auriculariales sp. MPI-PUGE-AT-0066]
MACTGLDAVQISDQLMDKRVGLLSNHDSLVREFSVTRGIMTILEAVVFADTLSELSNRYTEAIQMSQFWAINLFLAYKATVTYRGQQDVLIQEGSGVRTAGTHCGLRLVDVDTGRATTELLYPIRNRDWKRTVAQARKDSLSLINVASGGIIDTVTTPEFHPTNDLTSQVIFDVAQESLHRLRSIVSPDWTPQMHANPSSELPFVDNELGLDLAGGGCNARIALVRPEKPIARITHLVQTESLPPEDMSEGSPYAHERDCCRSNVVYHSEVLKTGQTNLGFSRRGSELRVWYTKEGPGQQRKAAEHGERSGAVREWREQRRALRSRPAGGTETVCFRRPAPRLTSGPLRSTEGTSLNDRPGCRGQIKMYRFTSCIKHLRYSGSDRDENPAGLAAVDERSRVLIPDIGRARADPRRCAASMAMLLVGWAEEEDGTARRDEQRRDETRRAVKLDTETPPIRPTGPRSAGIVIDKWACMHAQKQKQSGTKTENNE